MNRINLGRWLAFSLASVIGLIVVSPSASAEKKATSADGDSCDIELPNGTKKPGTKKGDKCCSVFDSNDCVDLPRPVPSKAGTLAVTRVGVKGVLVSATRTPTPRKTTKVPVGKAKDLAPARTPTP